MRSTTNYIAAAVRDPVPPGAGRNAGFTTTWQLVALTFLGIFALNLLLRIFYIRYQFVNGDEAVRALTGLGILRGARLYVDIITDKPPGTTLFYAAVLSVFRHSMPAVHIAAILWNFATAVTIYALGSRFYSRKTGLWASLLFVYFSASYHTQDAMAANTELLMSLPYTLSVYAYLRADPHTSWRSALSRRSQFLSKAGTRAGLRRSNQCLGWLVAAGVFAGTAAAFKQIGILVLVFFALNEALTGIIDSRIAGPRAQDDAEQSGDRGKGPDAENGIEPAARGVIRIVGRLSLIAIGVALVAALLAGWLWGIGAMSGFWRNAVQVGVLYVGSLPARLWIKFLFFRSLGYVLLTAALWVLAGLGLGRALTAVRLSIRPRVANASRQVVAAADSAGGNATDASIGLWCLVSLAGVFTSGRFYGHYFIPALPALSLLGARGAARLSEEMTALPRRRQGRVLLVVVLVLFLFNIVRFHHRTVILAYESVTGRRTSWSQSWGMSRREREAEQAANTIRSLGMAEGEPLYIWGYVLDVYWRSECIPASRYLTPYYVTGGFYPEVPAEAGQTGVRLWSEARSQFIEDLKRSRPRLILNMDEPIERLPYPEIVDFVRENYQFQGLIGRDPAYQFIVYTRR